MCFLEALRRAQRGRLVTHEHARRREPTATALTATAIATSTTNLAGRHARTHRDCALMITMVVSTLNLIILDLPASLTWRERMRAQRHIRPHTNPLQSRFTAQRLEKDQVQFDAARPLHVDIGCGKGHFCADLASSRPDINVLGIEIREQLVDEAKRLRELTASGNLDFVAGSANALFAPCVDALQPGALASCSVQFPDPWPRRRHQKRRVVQQPLVRDIASRLPSGGFVFLQSDVEELAREMRTAFLECGAFQLPPAEQHDQHGWLLEDARPFESVRTERERQATRRQLSVWRALLVRTSPITTDDG